MQIVRCNMKNALKRFGALLIVLSILLSLTAVTVSAAGSTQSRAVVSNWGVKDQECTSISSTGLKYYTGDYTYDKLDDLKGDTLKTTLKTLMKQNHKTSSYNDCHYKADITDCQNGDGYVYLIYTGYKATMSQWDGWNREHVWPQSLGGGNTSGGGADLHHIRPSDAGVNSSRGNKKYGEVTNGTAKYGSNPATGYLGGHYNSTYFEPLDSVKGDLARICLYVYVRWGSEWGADSLTKVFQSVDVLLKWCEEDPVDTWEMGRNDAIQSIQGNRNVFIDYPELAWLVTGRDIPDDMQTPSGSAMGGSGDNGGNNGDDDVTDPPVCTHTNTEIVGAKTATCSEAGYSGDTYCADCGVKIANGKTIPKTTHTASDWIVDDEPTETEVGSKHKECTVCGDVLLTESIPAIGTTPPDDDNTGSGDGTGGDNTGGDDNTGDEPECTHSDTEIRDKKDATCSEAGYTGDTYCADCGMKLVSGSATDKTAHTEGGWIVDKEPTVTEQGSRHTECSVCGETVKTEAIAKLELNLDFGGAVAQAKAAETLSERYAAINAALDAYYALSDAERTAAASAYAELVSLIGGYNDNANTVNEDNVAASIWMCFVIIADAEPIPVAYIPSKKMENC